MGSGPAPVLAYVPVAVYQGITVWQLVYVLRT